ncbi:MAG TPA: uroporphyrinogen decarboxylase family protein [Chloroflexota bacterium]|nr:uroporphyrinogen decarboxylase family protein [Chloroflexota bacterium]
MTETARPGTVHRASGTRLSHRDRVRAALASQPVDRPAVSFWVHFPGEDQAPDGLATCTLDLQRTYDLDIVKLHPTGMYPVVDYGVAIRLSSDGLGTTEYVSGPVSGPDDWSRVPAASPDQGELARQIEAVRRVRAGLGDDTPIIQTIYSPLSLAAKLVGGKLTPALMTTPSLPPLLARLAADVTAFGKACIEAGADGFFFASQLANSGFDRDEYERLGVPYDLQVLSALRPLAWIVVLHLHGDKPYMHLADRYPVDALSWEDRETTPGIAEARTMTRRSFVAGVGRRVPLASGRPEDVAEQVGQAVADAGDRGLVVAPGCTIPVSVSRENLQALRSAVEP